MDKKSVEAFSMIGLSASLADDSKEDSYIPLINLRSEKIECKECLREERATIKNLRLSFDFDKHVESETCSTLSNKEKISCDDSGESDSLCEFYAINAFLPFFHYPCHPKVTPRKWIAEDYTEAIENIYASIKYSHRKTLIVWCPTSDIESEIIHDWLKKNTVFIYDRWIHQDMSYAKTVWGGVVAIYSDRIAAKKAAEEIPLQYESLKAISVTELIECFMKSELKYFSEEKAQVFVHAKVSGREIIRKIESVLDRFGKVVSCSYDYILRNAAVDFEVIYASATHAFLAQTILDNLPFGFSLLEVEIKLTPRLKAIFDDFRCQLKKRFGKEYFPF